MKPFDRQLDADVQEEIDRLEAALRGDADADHDLRALVEDVRSVRPTLDTDARERLEARIRVASNGGGDRSVATARGSGYPGRRRWRLALALAAVAAAAVPVAGVVVVNDGGDEAATLSSRAVSDDSSAPSVDSSTKSEPQSADLSAEADVDVLAESSLAPEPPPGAEAVSGSAESIPAPNAGRSSSGTTGSSSSDSSLGKDRSVVREARQVVRVESSAVATAASEVSEIVAGQGGYVDASSVSEGGSSPRAVFGIVVPSNRLDATIAAIGRIGKPVDLERTTSDVTAQRASIDDRLRDLRADRSSVRLQLARATDADQRAAKRRELRVLSSRIARLEGQQRELRGQVATARLALTLTTERSDSAASPTGDDERWGLSTAWHDAGRVLEVIGGILLLAAVALIPLAAVVGLAAVAIGRLTATRKNRTIGEA